MNKSTRQHALENVHGAHLYSTGKCEVSPPMTARKYVIRPLLAITAMMPRPVANAMPKPIVGIISVSPFVIGISEAPITWQTTEVATSAIMLGVNVIMLRSPAYIC